MKTISRRNRASSAGKGKPTRAEFLWRVYGILCAQIVVTIVGALLVRHVIGAAEKTPLESVDSTPTLTPTLTPMEQAQLSTEEHAKAQAGEQKEKGEEEEEEEEEEVDAWTWWIGKTMTACVLADLPTIIALCILVKKPVINLALLGLHTVLTSVLVGLATMGLSDQHMYQGLTVTVATFFGLLSYVFQHPGDDISWVQMWLHAMVASALVHLLAALLWGSSALMMYAAAAVTCSVIVVDAALVNHRFPTTAHVEAALTMYTDFVRLLMEILKILEKFDKK